MSVREMARSSDCRFCQCEGGAGVPDLFRYLHDREPEQDEEKLAETSPRRKDLGNEPSCTAILVGLDVCGVGDRHDRRPKDLDEADRDPEAEESEEEDLHTRRVCWQPAVVVRRNRSPLWTFRVICEYCPMVQLRNRDRKAYLHQ